MNLQIEQYQCAIFDLDGTLLDSTGIWEKIDIDFLGKRGIPVPPDYIQDIKMHNFETGSVYTVKRFHLQEDPVMIAREWMDMAKEEYHHNIQLKPNAKEYLLKLKAHGLKLAVATSSDQELYVECLKRNGIYDLFDSFTETKDVKNGKGFPDVYIAAADKCKTETRKCLVFEDILKGIEGSKKGGFYTIGVYDNASSQDELRIRELSDLFIRDYCELL